MEINVISVKENDYRSHSLYRSKDEAINMVRNSNFSKKNLVIVKRYKKFFSINKRWINNNNTYHQINIMNKMKKNTMKTINKDWKNKLEINIENYLMKKRL